MTRLRNSLLRADGDRALVGATQVPRGPSMTEAPTADMPRLEDPEHISRVGGFPASLREEGKEVDGR